MTGKSGTDARFPSKVRQIVVYGRWLSLTSDQKVGDSKFVAEHTDRECGRSIILCLTAR